MASRDHAQDNNDAATEGNEEEVMMNEADVEEEIDDMDEDAPMGGMNGDDEDEPLVEGGGVEEALELQNDSIAHFDKHGDSVFSITSHPRFPLLVATGSGDDTVFVWSADPQPDLLPPSFQQEQKQRQGLAQGGGASGDKAEGGGDSSDDSPGRASLASIARLTGHSDSVIATAFSKPRGEFLLTAGMDGRVRVYRFGKGGAPPRDSAGLELAAEAQEVEEVTWLSVCPNPDRSNVFAFGGSDGSVWVYEIIDQSSGGGGGGGTVELQLLQAYYQHTTPCTAGAWSAAGTLLATVSEESSLYVFDPFGLAPGGSNAGTAAVVALTADDQRFAVEGGLYSVAVSPGGTLCAVGGHGGSIRVVGLPRTTADPAAPVASAAGSTKSQKGGQGARAKAGSGRQAGASGATQQGGGGQAGQIVASLSAGGDSVEALAFSPTGALLVAGDVDGNIRLFDTAHNFALRRHVPEAHENQAVVRFEWEPVAKTGGNTSNSAASASGSASTAFYSAGMDGVLKKWDARTGTLLNEWKGHRGGGEGGGILAFVLLTDEDDGGRKLVVTAGDDSVNLVFDVGASA